nr:MAG TPA: hypothetical protein [Caudoviricetes sp.]
MYKNYFDKHQYMKITQSATKIGNTIIYDF